MLNKVLVIYIKGQETDYLVLLCRQFHLMQISHLFSYANDIKNLLNMYLMRQIYFRCFI